MRAFGLNFPNPIGMAAGFDKSAEVPDALLRLGFGFVEIGTVTPKPQGGNPRPRLFRLERDEAVINRMGFNNDGAEVALRRLAARAHHGGIVGVNVGANKDSSDRVADYVKLIETFAPVASYFTVNVSSPNTPGLRNLQQSAALDDLLAKVIDARERVRKNAGDSPVLLKIFNHLTFAVPGRSDRYYQIPFGTHWSEVTASCFMEVGIDDGEVKRGEGEVERSCYCIHAPIHKALPQAKAVFHTHMPHASALTRLEDPRIKEIGQTEVGLSGAIAYDDEYAGPALDPAEGARLARVIGDKKVLFMANHGISTVGATVAEAYDMLYYVERAAQVQIYAMWTGTETEAASGRRGRKDPARLQGRSSLQGPDPGPAAFRCAEADAGSQGAGLRDVVSPSSPRTLEP